ncbi:MAG: DUF3343 domain-containing protein [Clostridium sp.]
MDKYYILVFNNTHEAMKAESVCKSENIKPTMMPTPSYITKSCGISLKVNEDQIENIKQLIKNEKLTIKSMFMKDGASYGEVTI